MYYCIGNADGSTILNAHQFIRIHSI